ncbi:MAG: glycosyltransferase family 39 protein, partial [Isosphaeraceae bacterium]
MSDAPPELLAAAEVLDSGTGGPGHKTSRATLAVAGIVAIHAGLLAYGAWCHSAAWDEVGHFAAGLSHWKLGHFRLYRVNLPLVRLVATAPVLLAHPVLDWDEISADPHQRPEWEVGKKLAKANGRRYFRLLTLARWACIPFSIMGALVCRRWASDLYGPTSGLFALVLYCFCPNIITYGQLIVPDAPAAALGAAAHYMFWRHLENPHWKRSVGIGTVFGLMQLCKSTWVFAFLYWPMLWAVDRVVRRHAPGRQRAAVSLAQLATILGLGLFVLNAGYLFQGSFKRLGDYSFQSMA